jgi:hypothetical protein
LKVAAYIAIFNLGNVLDNGNNILVIADRDTNGVTTYNIRIIDFRVG